MKMKSTAFIVLAAFAAAAAQPALAKASLSKSQKICETAAESADPAPKSVRTDGGETVANDDVATFTLRVKNADDSSSKLICSVDRETLEPTIKVAS